MDVSAEVANWVCGGLLAVGLGWEAWALASGHTGATWSVRVREWFRTHTRPGRAVFAVGWVAFAVWFLGHILGWF